MKHTMIPQQISILGAGNIGMALATLWSRAGHSVCLGARDPDKVQAIVNEQALSVAVKSIEDAARAFNIIVLAVSYSALTDIIPKIKNDLAGKIIIDATNPFGLSPEGHVISTLGPNLTEGTYMASLLPNSTVIRAFSHIMDELLLSRGTRQPGLFAMAIAGDDSNAKSQVADLVRDTGFVSVDIGTLAESAPLDPGGILFPQFFTVADMKLTLKNRAK